MFLRRGAACEPASSASIEGNGTSAKKAGKIQKTAFFDPSNPFYLGRTGVSVFRTEHHGGTRTGEIPCFGSGPEPVTGFDGVCSALLLLLLSRDRALRRKQRRTPT